ncbi:Calcium-transporting ATPase [Handroanthus impetiginosus]|uniref:Calcium-transporting ATPase n=1 Tax=Handroanthus impetiginosus TaxID=429701 RepID=A0A2G9H5F5_9LAMI|nr:Calcium-transporting ATPase [Handroanthus impetiginosus]
MKNRSSSVLISKNSDNTIHVHKKGAPDVIIPMCSHFYESSGTVKVINRSEKALSEEILRGMAEKGLRCFALAHRKTSIRDYFTFSGQRLILLGIVGLKNSRRSGTRRTVEECRRAGVNLKLITGDSPTTAIVVAANCGIVVDPDHRRGEVVQGKDFKELSLEERMARVDNIRVLASATPEHKYHMVQCLKMKGHVVACLGQGIGDVMALREADVAICFGTQGAEIAKANSPIVLYRQQFPLITDILMWGRGLYDTMQIYAQFLITATFVALIVEFVKMVCGQHSTGKVPSPVFELLWLKLITGTFSALALTIKPPTEGVMQNPPTSREHPLISSLVRTNICIQVIYQVTVLLTIHFKGGSFFYVDSDKKEAMIFNTYILYQVFSMFDTSLSKTSNILEEIQKKKVAWGIMVLIIFVQFLMIEVLKKLAGMAVSCQKNHTRFYSQVGTDSGNLPFSARAKLSSYSTDTFQPSGNMNPSGGFSLFFASVRIWKNRNNQHNIHKNDLLLPT